MSLAGPLLDAIQMSALYPDSKTFVDKKLKQSPGKIIKRFDDLVKSNDGKSLTKDQIKEVSGVDRDTGDCSLFHSRRASLS